jgi:dsRNA-specific ribonuclease
VVFCKSILNEFAVKSKATQPTYSINRPEGLPRITLFVSSVLFAGNTYTGEAATNKKDAEQKAARAAVKSILGNLLPMFCI